MTGDNSSSKEKPSLYKATVARKGFIHSCKVDKIFTIVNAP